MADREDTYARLRELGLSHDLAARTAGHQWGPWRLSRTEALSYAMPAAYFDRLGLPSLRCTTARNPTEPPCTDRTHGGVTGKRVIATYVNFCQASIAGQLFQTAAVSSKSGGR